jgi:16S rRNA (adenine1518-N6/adenine1519-N6)-dimethyltransferase
VLTISQIRDILRENGLKANRKLGQNFLIDKNIVNKILAFANIQKQDIVLEIGAGLGNATSELAKTAKKVIAVEFDKGLCRVAAQRLKGLENIEFICQDILKFDFKASFAGQGGIKVIGNLPYCITTPILEQLVDNRAVIRDALVMVQREFADRMLAKPGSKAYGSLACFVGFYTEAEFMSAVKRTSFYPEPEVDSALVRLRPRQAPPVAVKEEDLFFKIIRLTFNQRRKTVLSTMAGKNALGLTREFVRTALEKAAVPADSRPETLGMEEFARIANELSR